jgi:uncharacterized delta-60 repeat protein
MIFRLLLILAVPAAPLFGNTPDLFASSAKPNGTVHDIAQQSDGRIVVVGAFTMAGSSSRNRIARYRINGTLDPVFSPGDGANAAIHHVAITGDDEIVIAGDFTSYQGHSALHAAVLNPNGSFKRALNLPESTAAVHALEVAGGAAYIGGSFTGYFRHYNLLGGYSLPKPSGSPDAPVNAIAVEDVPEGPFITLGGDFTRIGSTNVGYIAHLDRHARLTAASTANSGANRRVTALGFAPAPGLSPGPSMIVVAGEFSSFNGSSRSRLATIHSANTRYASPTPGSLSGSLGTSMPFISGSIDAVQARRDGTIAIGGDFRVTTGGYTNLVLANVWGGFGIGDESDHRPNGAVHGFCEQRDGMLLVGGEFATIDGLSRPRLARLYGPGGTSAPGAPVMDTVTPLDDGTIYVSWHPSSSTSINHYLVQREIILGNWAEVGIVSSDRLRFIDDGLNGNTSYKYRVLTVSGTGSSAGSIRSATTMSAPALGTAEATFDTSVNPQLSILSVNRISIDAEQRILAASSARFHQNEGYQLHRLLPNGLLDDRFGCSFDGGLVGALECLRDGKTMIGGGFLTVNGQPKEHLARLLEDGSSDPGFNSRPDARVDSILPLTDGSYLIAGSFTTVNGEAHAAIARLDSGGQPDQQFRVAINGYSLSSASNLRQARNGAIYCAATISADGGGTNQTTILKIDASGVLDETFSVPATLEVNLLSQFALGPDDTLYLAGRLWPDPKPANFRDTRLVRLLGDGAIDPSFSGDGYSPPYLKVYTSVETAPGITALIIPGDGRAITAGDYNFFSGRPRFGIGRHSTSGELDDEFVGGTGPQGIASWHEDGFYQLPVHDFAALPNGTVVAGGDFFAINGIERQRVAALHSGPYTAPAVKPSPPAVTPRGNGRLFVSWTPLAGMTGYVVERQLAGESNYLELARVPSTWRHYIDALDHGTAASYRIRSISGDTISGASGSSTATATSPFGAWKESHGLSADADPGRDDDGDQLTLLLEYALRRDPGAFDTEPWHVSFSSEALVVDTPRPDLIYSIESSGNLHDWESAASVTGGPDRILTLPITPGTEPELYFRLSVLPR